MKFFKKIILILVAISLLTLFIGCPPKPIEEVIEKTIEEVTTKEATEELTTIKEETTEATEEVTTIEETTITEEIEETITESAEEEIEEDIVADTDEKYVSVITTIISALKSSIEKLNQATFDLEKGKISIPERKEIMKEYIEDIKTLYDTYLELKPSKRLEKHNDLFGKAMDQLLKSTIFYQKYIDTDDIEEMTEYFKQAIKEHQLYMWDMLRAISELERITE